VPPPGSESEASEDATTLALEVARAEVADLGEIRQRVLALLVQVSDSIEKAEESVAVATAGTTSFLYVL
jgi:hypothetical protein